MHIKYTCILTTDTGLMSCLWGKNVANPISTDSNGCTKRQGLPDILYHLLPWMIRIKEYLTTEKDFCDVHKRSFLLCTQAVV